MLRTKIILLLFSLLIVFPAHADASSDLLAAEKGHIDIVQTLLNKDANIKAKDKWDKTALMYTAEAGHINIVKILLHKNVDVEAKNQFGKTALMLAEKNGHGEIAGLLKHISKPEIMTLDKLEKKPAVEAKKKLGIKLKINPLLSG